MNDFQTEYDSQFAEQTIIDQLVSPRETVLWRGRPSWRGDYVMNGIRAMIPIVIIWLLFDGGFIAALFSFELPSKMLLFIIPFFALHLLPVWIFVGKYAKNAAAYKDAEYALTNNSLVVSDRLCAPDARAVPLADVIGVSLSISRGERKRGLGTVNVDTIGARYPIRSIDNPQEVCELVRNAADAHTEEPPVPEEPDSDWVRL